jgi:hypothetical protein
MPALVVATQAVSYLHEVGFITGSDTDSSDVASHTVPIFDGLASLWHIFKLVLWALCLTVRCAADLRDASEVWDDLVRDARVVCGEPDRYYG